MEHAATILKTDQKTSLGRPYNVILFNDEIHGMDEVRAQIDKAIHCGFAQADAIMLKAHRTGRAVVITANLERCEHVAAVLEEIRLGTKIEPA
jgi:ATP-dependent Clp protease adapter protein ClpS